jgi:hypothetical protein
MHCWGGLFERLTAIGVWATRPHLCCVAAKEGESPSLLSELFRDRLFIEKCREGLFERLTAIGVWATRPHLSCLAVKEGESPSLLCSLPFFGSLPLSLIDACARVSGTNLSSRRPSAMKNVSTPMEKTGRARRRVQGAQGSSVGKGILWWNLLENENSGWGRRRRSLDQY